MNSDFEVLGLTQNASDKEIRAAYMRLVLIHHPDKGGDAGMFRRVDEAYKRLLRRDQSSLLGTTVVSSAYPEDMDSFIDELSKFDFN